MSFRDNLQHLRATRNMTQEQLAMLLGVSRQSVTKWEAEKSYPEMDKLIKICQIFECSLDDLVQGDLTMRPNDPVAAMPATGTAQDICGYDEHQRKMARRIPTGVAIAILAVAMPVLLNEALFLTTPDATGSLVNGLTGVCMFGLIAIALAFLVPAGMEMSAFNKEHPFIEDFYTKAEKDDARRHLSTAIVAGVGVALAGMCLPAIFEDTPLENLSGGAFLLFAAVSAWIIVHWGMLYSRVNIAQRNKNIAGELDASYFINAAVDERVRESLRGIRGGKKTRKQELISGICGIIMIIATIAGLTMLFWPLTNVGPAGVDAIDWDDYATTNFFWLAWPIGGMLCGIATIIINMLCREE